MKNKRTNLGSGNYWEEIVGYSRAVKIGNIIEVAGTTAVDNGVTVGQNDPYIQTRFILEKIEKALIAMGASMNDVIRTRMYVVDISQWEAIGKAHREFFQEIRPAATMVEVKSLINEELLVEIEVTAILK